MTVRKLMKVLILILLMLLASETALASVSCQGEYKVIIDDEQDLLTESEEKNLKEKMSQVAEYGNVAFVTVYQYEDTGSYAEKVYRSYFGRESGMLFMIDMGRRNIWIFCDGAIYRVIDKAYAYTITDNIYRYAKDGDYYNCALSAFDQALILLKGGTIAQPMKYISNALIACVLALLINFIFLTYQRSNDETIIARSVPALTTTVGAYILSKRVTSRNKTRHVQYSSSSGGSSGGGFSGGGGGGGGGSSGGGGGHSF